MCIHSTVLVSLLHSSHYYFQGQRLYINIQITCIHTRMHRTYTCISATQMGQIFVYINEFSANANRRLQLSSTATGTKTNYLNHT